MKRTFGFALAIVSGALWLAGPGCDDGAGVQRVELEVEAIGLGGSAPFENVPPTGIEPWTVELDEAWVALGPIYLFEGDPLLGRLLERLIMPRAFAHPGHYQEGEAMGEALDQVVVDLLEPEPTRMGSMNAVTGEVRSARIGLGTAEDGLAEAEALEGHALRLRGVASRADEAVEFEAWLDVDLYVEGVAFEHEVTEEPGRLEVEVDLTRWLRRVDFATATPGDEPGAPASLDDGSQAHNALSRGVDNTLAYTLRWMPAEEP